MHTHPASGGLRSLGRTGETPVRLKSRALVIGVATEQKEPWWMRHLDAQLLQCHLECHSIVVRTGRPRSVFSLGFVSMFVQCVRILLRARADGFRYILTFEGGWLSFIVASLQKLLVFRTPKHVILQFIMRERTPALKSRLKYAFMEWCLSSVHLFVCSSRAECAYYLEAFGWPRHRVAYVPLHTDPAFVLDSGRTEQPFVIAAGRTFRDYRTLMEAVTGTSIPLTIVASPSSIGDLAVPSNVRLLYDIPLSELLSLIASSMVVVVPLEERRISIGQSVVLQAMAMGRAVVATRVSGTEDYIRHLETGFLVPAQDPTAMRAALITLAADAGLRGRLGAAARAQVEQEHLPTHYAMKVSSELRALAAAR